MSCYPRICSCTLPYSLSQLPFLSLSFIHPSFPRRLDANHISSVPPGCFSGLVSLRHLWLDDNALTEVPVSALGALPSLQAMTLALNRITHIPDRAFANLSSLVVLRSEEHTSELQSR